MKVSLRHNLPNATPCLNSPGKLTSHPWRQAQQELTPGSKREIDEPPLGFEEPSQMPDCVRRKAQHSHNPSVESGHSGKAQRLVKRWR